MSTTATATATAPGTTRAAGPHLTFPRVVRSEWIKLRTLRSTYWTLGITVAVMVLFAWAMAASVNAMGPDAMSENGGVETSAALVYTALGPGQAFGSLVLVVVAALTVTGEYGTGQIRSTLAAVPSRLPVLWAKSLVVLVVSFLTAAVGTALSLLLAGLIAPVLRPEWSDPETVRVVLGTPLYIAGVALLGFAVGALLRNTAATIAIVIGFVLVIESVLSVISWKPLEYVRPFLPSSAGARVSTPQEFIDMTNEMLPSAVALGPWTGYAVLIGWVVVIGSAAAWRLRTRDA
jgi:ABC-2 type transport system permease protein